MSLGGLGWWTGPLAPKVVAACRRRVVFAGAQGKKGKVHKVQKVQKVQRVLPASGRRVQRVVVSPLRGDEVL